MLLKEVKAYGLYLRFHLVIEGDFLSLLISKIKLNYFASKMSYHIMSDSRSYYSRLQIYERCFLYFFSFNFFDTCLTFLHRLLSLCQRAEGPCHCLMRNCRKGCWD